LSQTKKTTRSEQQGWSAWPGGGWEEVTAVPEMEQARMLCSTTQTVSLWRPLGFTLSWPTREPSDLQDLQNRLSTLWRATVTPWSRLQDEIGARASSQQHFDLVPSPDYTVIVTDALNNVLRQIDFVTRRRYVCVFVVVFAYSFV